jgi:hypothetical protein
MACSQESSRDDLYVGGNFSESGDGSLVSLGGIARFDKNASTWHALPNRGFQGVVSALLAGEDGLFVDRSANTHRIIKGV